MNIYDPENKTTDYWGKKYYFSGFCVLMGVIFCFIFYQQFRMGVLLACTPDSVEPLTGALELLEGKGFSIQLNGVHYPPRYTPPLALLLIPGLWITGGDFRSAGVVIAVFGVITLFALLGMMRKNNRIGIGILFCGALTLYPCFLELCSMIMTEIPYLALLSMMLWCFCRMSKAVEPDWRLWLCYGLLTAGAGTLRSSGYPMLAAPLLLAAAIWRRNGKIYWSSMILLIFPSLLTLAASAYYNYAIFGSFLRSGYHYHCPVPYDYWNLTFSLKYIVPNLKNFFFTGGRGVLVYGAGLLSVLLYVIFRAKRPDDSGECKECFAAIIFILLQNMTLFFLYIGHVYFCLRFFLPGGVLLMWLCCRIFASFGERLSIRWQRLLQLSCGSIGTVLLLFGIIHPVFDYCGNEIRAMKFYCRHLPADAILIHNGEPGRCELFFRRNTRRRQIPSDRSVEYCNKIAMPYRVEKPVPFPVFPCPHRAEFLLHAPGHIDFFPQVFEESPEQILHTFSSSVNCYVTGKALLKLPYQQQLALKRQYCWKIFCKAPFGDAVYRVAERQKSVR